MSQCRQAYSWLGSHPLLTILFLAELMSSPYPVLAQNAIVSIQESEQGIRLEAVSAPLREVLHSVEEKSGTQFKVHGNLGEDRVSVNVSAKDWFAIISRLLENYGTLFFWGDDGEIESVWVMRDGSEVPKVLSGTNESEKKLNTTHDGIKPYQLRQLLHIPAGYRIPVELFIDPKIQEYLKENGIHSPEDWENRHLAGIVRRKAEREFNAIILQYKLGREVKK